MDDVVQYLVVWTAQNREEDILKIHRVQPQPMSYERACRQHQNDRLSHKQRGSRQLWGRQQQLAQPRTYRVVWVWTTSVPTQCLLLQKRRYVVRGRLVNTVHGHADCIMQRLFHRKCAWMSSLRGSVGYGLVEVVRVDWCTGLVCSHSFFCSSHYPFTSLTISDSWWRPFISFVIGLTWSWGDLSLLCFPWRSHGEEWRVKSEEWRVINRLAIIRLSFS